MFGLTVYISKRLFFIIQSEQKIEIADWRERDV